ncbi:MAG: hypothetical protein ACRDVD_05185, partial [Acidimicrobiia bacterium]
MTTAAKTVRLGLDSRQAFDRWVEGMDVLVGAANGEVTAWEATPPPLVAQEAWPEATWALGPMETGRVEFRDSGAEASEMTIRVDRSDPDPDALTQRLNGILDRFGTLIAAQAGTVDLPAVLE